MSRQLSPSITLFKGTVTGMLAYAKGAEQVAFCFVTDCDSGKVLEDRVDRALDNLKTTPDEFAAICREKGLSVSTMFFNLEPDGVLTKTQDESYDYLIHNLNCNAERSAPRRTIVVTDSLKIGNEMLGEVPYIGHAD